MCVTLQEASLAYILGPLVWRPPQLPWKAVVQYPWDLLDVQGHPLA